MYLTTRLFASVAPKNVPSVSQSISGRLKSAGRRWSEPPISPSVKNLGLAVLVNCDHVFFVDDQTSAFGCGLKRVLVRAAAASNSESHASRSIGARGRVRCWSETVHLAVATPRFSAPHCRGIGSALCVFGQVDSRGSRETFVGDSGTPRTASPRCFPLPAHVFFASWNPPGMASDMKPPRFHVALLCPAGAGRSTETRHEP